MVWFQCEVCGESLKKPKLPNHFRICAATKLSCVDCGKVFDQESVQGHTQCVTEAEKYGPKGLAKGPNNAQAKPKKANQQPEVDVSVGLSSRAPWNCSLCNTFTTSRETLLGHADGKKHRAKARAFHASQKQPIQTEEQAPNGNAIKGDLPMPELVESNGITEDRQLKGNPPDSSGDVISLGENESLAKGKRKCNAYGDGTAKINYETELTGDACSGHPKKKKPHADGRQDEHIRIQKGCGDRSPEHKIKWKKVIKSTLKSNQDSTLKVKKLQKLVLGSLREAGVTDDETRLQEKLMEKILSSSKFIVTGKRVCLAEKVE